MAAARYPMGGTDMAYAASADLHSRARARSNPQSCSLSPYAFATPAPVHMYRHGLRYANSGTDIGSAMLTQ
eukprot:748496-Rhodomonas_salina.1